MLKFTSEKWWFGYGGWHVQHVNFSPIRINSKLEYCFSFFKKCLKLFPVFENPWNMMEMLYMKLRRFESDSSVTGARLIDLFHCNFYYFSAFLFQNLEYFLNRLYEIHWFIKTKQTNCIQSINLNNITWNGNGNEINRNVCEWCVFECLFFTNQSKK